MYVYISVTALQDPTQIASTTGQPRSCQEKIYALLALCERADKWKVTSDNAVSLAGDALHSTFINLVDISISNKARYFQEVGNVKLQGISILDKDAKQVSVRRRNVLERRIEENLVSIYLVSQQLSMCQSHCCDIK